MRNQMYYSDQDDALLELYSICAKNNPSMTHAALVRRVAAGLGHTENSAANAIRRARFHRNQKHDQRWAKYHALQHRKAESLPVPKPCGDCRGTGDHRVDPGICWSCFGTGELNEFHRAPDPAVTLSQVEHRLRAGALEHGMDQAQCAEWVTWIQCTTRTKS